MTRFDRFALFAILALAALLRLPGIESRHGFDADQGHDMLVLFQLTREGAIPLLGPRTSVGEFHHGAFYYFLLAPAAAISGSDPVAVTVFIALLGIAAVALTWWLAREIGGLLAGALAGLLMAVSPAGIEQSTFVWNPNPIAFFAVLALAAAWRARAAGRARWWAVAIGGAGAVVQLHVLGVVFFVAILVIALWHVRRDRATGKGIVGGLAIVAILFLPLLIHELQTGFLETRRVLDYLASDDPAPGSSPLATLAFTLLRIVGWPLVGLVTDVPMLAAVVLAVVTGLTLVGLLLAQGREPSADGGPASAARTRDARPDAAVALWWFIGILAWSTFALAFAAPSLQRVVPGLPNDHYHAFADPIVVMLVAIPAAWLLERGLAAWRATRRPTAALASIAMAAGVAALVMTAVVRKPAHNDPNGWPAMRDAGARIATQAAGLPIAMIGLPDFKLSEAVDFPIVLAGGEILPRTMTLDDGLFVIACDRLFEAAIGAPCGGAAEDARAAEIVAGSSGTFDLELVDRFDASPRTSISVFRGIPSP